MSRREVREQIFKLLFHIEFNSLDEMEHQVQLFYEAEENIDVSEQDREEVTTKLNAILGKLEEIDQMINENTVGWTTARIAKVELTILRLALYEIKFDETVPDSVAINEAIEIAKKYGQKDSYSFVNGVLTKFSD